MKTLTLLAAVVIILISCNNAANEPTNQLDTTSSLPAPATVDTNSLHTDTPNVQKAIKK